MYEITKNVMQDANLSAATKIVMAVIRYTYGFSRKDAELSLVYLSNATGVDKRNLRREINVLISDKGLKVTKEATFKQPRMFRINKDYEE